MTTRPTNREELVADFGGDVYEDGSQELRLSEDDGNFFLEEFGVRLCPELSVGQGSSRRDFNRAVNQWLTSMGYSERYNGVGMV